MSTKKVYSVCGMCTVRCPIQVEVKDGSPAFLQGDPLQTESRALCAPEGLPGLPWSMTMSVHSSP